VGEGPAPMAGQPLQYPPVLFMVASFTEKKLILDVSYQHKDTIRFYGNSSKEDCNARKTLLEEMKRLTKRASDYKRKNHKKNRQTQAILITSCLSMEK